MKVTSYLVASCPFRRREHSHTRVDLGNRVDCPHAYGVRGAGLGEELEPITAGRKPPPKDTLVPTYADTYGGRR